MNVNISLRNGRTFRFGFVERVFSDGRRLNVYATPGDRVKVGSRLMGRRMAEVDELSGFELRDVSEVALDDEPSKARFVMVR